MGHFTFYLERFLKFQKLHLIMVREQNQWWSNHLSYICFFLQMVKCKIHLVSDEKHHNFLERPGFENMAVCCVHTMNENTRFILFCWGSGFHFIIVFSVMGVGELKVCETCCWVGQVMINQVFFHFGIGLVVSALRFMVTFTSCKKGVK